MSFSLCALSLLLFSSTLPFTRPSPPDKDTPALGHRKGHAQFRGRRYALEEGQMERLSLYLIEIDLISRNAAGELCATHSKMIKMFPNLRINTDGWAGLPEKADLIMGFLKRLKGRSEIPRNPKDSEEMALIEELFQKVLQNPNLHFSSSFPAHTLPPTISSIRFALTLGNHEVRHYFLRSPSKLRVWRLEFRNETEDSMLLNHPWYYPVGKLDDSLDQRFVIDPEDEETHFWTWPYLQCYMNGNGNGGNGGKYQWLVSYTTGTRLFAGESAFGQISFDVDLSEYDINQCDLEEGDDSGPLDAFRGTNKCDRETTEPGRGFKKGSYNCLCIPNHHAFSPSLNNSINGNMVEVSWNDQWENKSNGNSTFEDIVRCYKCPKGCDGCIRAESCLAKINLIFRICLLGFSLACSASTIAIIIVVYRFRKHPVFKSSSPIFHTICLFGCCIMYSEMIVLFPELDQLLCVGVKWTRHLGFCITYTALYMKLCRVFLTFRVKSAHKIKLTEKHLLHWMSPIMVIMLLYLFAWTISDPPGTERLESVNGKFFYQCIYNWWDNALAIGEVIFLIYGVWICWRIRENPDARFISYSIYNIAFVNIFMVTIHLLIFPNAGPDLKYLFAFIRIQLSTTLTICFVFGSKLYVVLRGDPAAQKDLPNSANGFGHESLDLAEENQQLKEELQKMATQMEKIKSYAMCKNNPHLKSSSASTGSAITDKVEKLQLTSELSSCT